MAYIYIYIYMHKHAYINIHVPPFEMTPESNNLCCSKSSQSTQMARSSRHSSDGGHETVGNPHRAQISQFEFFELKFLNSSFSSLSSY